MNSGGNLKEAAKIVEGLWDEDGTKEDTDSQFMFAVRVPVETCFIRDTAILETMQNADVFNGVSKSDEFIEQKIAEREAYYADCSIPSFLSKQNTFESEFINS